MKSNKSAVALLTIAALAAGASAFAGEHGKTVNERQHTQNERIREGVKSGELTHREAARLRTHKNDINRYEHYARKDGNISEKEAYRLDKMQDRQNKAIYRQKHDKQDKP